MCLFIRFEQAWLARLHGRYDPRCRRLMDINSLPFSSDCWGNFKCRQEDTRSSEAFICRWGRGSQGEPLEGLKM